jgi:hypothetical protein
MGLKEEFQTARDWIDQHLSAKIANVPNPLLFVCHLFVRSLAFSCSFSRLLM